MIYVLTEERQDEMVRLVNAGGSVSVQELVDYFHISEATVRRDLSVLHQTGRLRRVHGGATALPSEEGKYEVNMEELEHKYSLHMAEKRRIAQYAASCVDDRDFIYLDAGSTVEQMADFLTGSATACLWHRNWPGMAYLSACCPVMSGEKRHRSSAVNSFRH